MKKNEIALLILIVGVVGLITYFALNSALAGLKPKPVSVDTADPISETLVAPNKDVFKEGAFNPTVKVNIGDQSNEQPFNAAQR